MIAIKMLRLLPGIMMVWLGMLWAGSARADGAQDIILRGKAATVLVDTTKGTGSAFCIDRSGLFITNAHVVEGVAAGETVKLVLSPGEKTEKVATARVLKADRSLDLALLQLEGKADLTALALGTDETLIETQPVTAFGYPFGKDLSVEQTGYPNISVSTGHITSLRKAKGELQQIQIDAVLNHGNSGGPVLDAKGEVIGIVRAGIEGAGVNFAIPVRALHAFLNAVEIVFDPLKLNYTALHAPQDFAVTLVAPGKSTADLRVDLTLSAGDKDHRAYVLTAADGRHFHVKAALLPAPGPSLLRLTLHTDDSEVVCRVADQSVTVGGERLKLSQLQRIEQRGTSVATCLDGRRITGPVVGLEGVATKVAGQLTRLNLNHIAEISIAPDSPEATAVMYKIVVTANGRALQSLTGAMTLPTTPKSVAGAAPAAPNAAPPQPAAGTVPAPRQPTDPAKTIVRLPGTIDDLAAGGNGRYLILQMKQLRQLAIFDVARRAVVKYIPIDSENFVFGASADKLLVLLPDRKLIQRWSLKTFLLELTVPGLEDGRTKSPAIGYSSNGPAVFQCGQKTVFLDLETLQPIKVQEQNRSQMAYFGTQYRAGAQSGTYGSWYDGLTPTGLISLTLNGATAQYRETFDSAGYVVPSADGSLLLTGKGLFTPDLHGVDTDKFDHIHCVPVYGPGFFLGIVGADGKAQVSLYSTSERRLLVTLPPFDELRVPGGGLYDWPRLGLTFEKRWHFYPAFGLMITVPDSRDQLVLRDIGVIDTLTRAGIDYLFVASTPPAGFRKGQRYRYQMEVRARRSPAHLHLDSGPRGMTLTPGGLLTWDVPADYAGKEETIVITIKDGAGQSIFHTFKITL